MTVEVQPNNSRTYEFPFRLWHHSKLIVIFLEFFIHFECLKLMKLVLKTQEPHVLCQEVIRLLGTIGSYNTYLRDARDTALKILQETVTL